MVRDVMDSLTDEQLASEVTQTEPGWPQLESFPFRECLRIVLNEEWEHRLYAERDLTSLEKEPHRHETRERVAAGNASALLPACHLSGWDRAASSVREVTPNLGKAL